MKQQETPVMIAYRLSRLPDTHDFDKDELEAIEMASSTIRYLQTVIIDLNKNIREQNAIIAERDGEIVRLNQYIKNKSVEYNAARAKILKSMEVLTWRIKDMENTVNSANVEVATVETITVEEE